MVWNYYNPEFECDQLNKGMLKYSPWSGHRRFGYDFIANMKPKNVVELGSFYGCSMFSFAQAVKDLKLETVLWGVDVWETLDEFTKDDYKENVYDSFCRVRKECFDDSYIKMLKMTFDQALDVCEENSIDVLHIDGSHFYEDVKHDFETWKSKLKRDAIVLFHDIGDEIINGGIMGSHRYWNEIKEQYASTIQFDFSCGLGILFLSREVYEKVIGSVDIGYYQRICNSFDVQMKDDIRKMSFKLRDANEYLKDLREQISIKDEHLENYKKDMKQLQIDYEKTILEKDEYIQMLESQRTAWNIEREQIKKDYESTISGKDLYIKELEDKLL